MNNQPIIALDFPDRLSMSHFFTFFPKQEKLFVKVGMELFYKEGPQVVEQLIDQGHSVFLDLKLHDIPHTVYRAMRNLGKLGVSITNVHASGGIEMMRAAKEGLLEGAQESRKKERPKLIAVTQLTSTSEEMMQKEQKIPLGLLECVLSYAQLTAKAGLDGVVCSALEAKDIHSQTHPDFICLTPGIRLIEDNNGDQKRVVTPDQARALTANYIVVGRPITKAQQPYEKYQQINQLWNGEK